jgi:LemA protein
MLLWIAIPALVTLVIVWAVSVYNRLIRLSNMKEEAWSGIDVQLKRRFDLIPNLVETVKGYASHEKDVFLKVTEARASISRAQTVEARAQSENMLSGALKSLFAVAENYPELKANANFLQLQEQLSSLENDIAIATFPAVLIARHFGFTKADFFETDEGERATPAVSFS